MANNEKNSPLENQVAGNHYKNLKIQPVEYIHANNIGFMEGNVIKYVTRWKTKNGIEDLKKAKHHLEMLIELEERRSASDDLSESSVPFSKIKEYLKGKIKNESEVSK